MKVPAGTVIVSLVAVIALTVGKETGIPSRVVCHVEDHDVPTSRGVFRT